MEAIATPLHETETDKLKFEVRRLRRLLREAQAEIARLEPLVDLDPLVPLFNRRAFMREVGRVASYCKRYGTTAILIYIDLDEFKSVNDRFGHAAGDAVLKHIAHLLNQSTRRSDIVGRLGGDEFGVLLVRTGARAGRAIAERIKTLIAGSAVTFAGDEITATASTGLALVDGADNEDRLIQFADGAMYRSRQAIMSGNSRFSSVMI